MVVQCRCATRRRTRLLTQRTWSWPGSPRTRRPTWRPEPPPPAGRQVRHPAARSARPTRRCTLCTGACEQATIEGRCATGATRGDAQLPHRDWLGAKWATWSPSSLHHGPGRPSSPSSASTGRGPPPTLLEQHRPQADRGRPVVPAAPPEIIEPADTRVRRARRVRPATPAPGASSTWSPSRSCGRQLPVGGRGPSSTRRRSRPPTTGSDQHQPVCHHRRIDGPQPVSLGVPVGAFQLLLPCWFAAVPGRSSTPATRASSRAGKPRGRDPQPTWALVGGQSAVEPRRGAWAWAIGGHRGYRTIVDASAVSQACRCPGVVVLLRSGAAAARARGRRGRRSPERAAQTLVGPRLLGGCRGPVRPARRARRRPRRRRVPGRTPLGLFGSRVASAPTGARRTSPGLRALLGAHLLAGRLPRARCATAARLVRLAIYLARRPGVHRLAALMIVTVALLGTSYITWDTGGDRRAQPGRAGRSAPTGC